MRVFVSSTTFDLIDARAEVESCLEEAGLTPVMSDRPTTEFHAAPDRNSIARCLVNLESCDAVIVILCQRYGPRLGDAGFEDESVTHLEYHHAKNKNKMIYFYVRDRLEADYRSWKQNDRSDSHNLDWIRGEKDRPLLNLLDEHRKLDAESDDNCWFDTFRDTGELKQLIRRDFRIPVSRAELESQIRRGDLPAISLKLEATALTTGSPATGTTVRFETWIVNSSSIPGYSVHIDERSDVNPDDQDATDFCLPILDGNERRVVTTRWGTVPFVWKAKATVKTQLSIGHWMVDSYELGASQENRAIGGCHCNLISRRFHVSDDDALPFEIVDGNDPK